MRYISSCVILISFFYLHNITNAIEPIGTIGHELPQKHVFHTNRKMLRVVQRHIEIVDVDTSEVEAEFGNLTEDSEVAFSPNNSHAAILDYSWKSDITTEVSSHFIKTWDVDSQQPRLLVSAEGNVFQGHAFSPDSQNIVVGK